MEKILGITPSIKIPKPIGGRIIIRPVKSSLTIEEQYKKAGLIGVAASKEKPRNSFGIILKVSADPIMQENFKPGILVYYPPLLGGEIQFLGHEFRSLDFNDILSSLDEDEYPEAYKDQVRSFLRGEQPNLEVSI